MSSLEGGGLHDFVNGIKNPLTTYIVGALSGKQKTAAGKTWRKVQNVNNFKAISKESNQ